MTGGVHPRGGGGGGLEGGTHDFKWQQLLNGGIKTPQNPKGFKQIPKRSLDQNLTPKIWAIKIYLHNYAAGIRGNYHKSSGGFEYPKKSLHLDQPTQNSTCKFSNPKKSQNWKFQTPKNPLITPVTWNREYPPWGSGLSKVASSWQKSPPTWLVSASYSAWHFFMDDVF